MSRQASVDSKARIRVLFVFDSEHLPLDLAFLSIAEKCSFLDVSFLAPSNKRDLLLKFENADSFFYNSQSNRLKELVLRSKAIRDNVSGALPDFVIFTGLEQFVSASSFLLSGIKRYNTTILSVIHNLDSWYFGKKTIFTGKKSEHSLKYKKKLYKAIHSRINGVFVLRDYLRKNAENVFKVKLDVIPFRISNDESIRRRILSVSKQEKPLFVIPGHVQCKRRNYSEVFKAFGDIVDDFDLVLLGKAYEESTIMEGRELLGDKLTFFNQNITEEVFADYMCRSHFIISNLNKNLSYGVLKASGAEFDGTAFGVPTLIPSDIHIEQEKNFLIRYERSNLKDTLVTCIESVKDGGYEDTYLKESLKCAEELLPQKWASRFYDFLMEVKQTDTKGRIV